MKALTTPTTFAWAAVGLPAWVPPADLRGEPGCCWLCGADCTVNVWRRSAVIKKTFTNHNQAKVIASDSLCEACAALSVKETWGNYVAAHPEEELKTGHAMSWRSYSHVFSETGHASPTRARWRDFLLNPPEPPFLFIITTSGQKHLIFRGRVSFDREYFPLLLEEEIIMVSRALFSSCLVDFEHGYALGFSKDSILSGRYHTAQMMKIGLPVWDEMERKIKPWRSNYSALMRLAHFCAQRPDEPATETTEGLI